MQNGGKLYAKLTSSFLRKWWVAISVGLTFLLFGLLTTFFFSPLVNHVIDQQLTLREGAQVFEMWRKPPVHPVMRIYIYNVTNADEFLSVPGTKPVLDEIGPFVYISAYISSKLTLLQVVGGVIQNPFSVHTSILTEETFLPNFTFLSITENSYGETWEKVDLSFLPNGTVTFNQRKVFKFDPENSVGTEDDVVIVPNIPMLSATSQSKHAARFLRLAIASIMDILKVKPFVEVTVGQLLWGYDDPLLKLAKDVVPKEQKLPYEEFGLLYGKNGTSKDIVTVFTGENDITKFGLVDKYNGKDHLTHWKTDQCNSLSGSDGSIFPPHMDKSRTLYVYDKDICRLLPLVFDKEVDTPGNVLGYRFTPPKNVFDSVEENKANDCFCPSPPCAPKGLFNVSLCQYDSPVMLSFPHFYLGNESLLEAVEGISKPDPEKHSLFIDVQPEMGVALRARARIQINLAVSHVADIKQVATFPDIVFPIMWFDDGIDGLPVSVTDLLRVATTAPASAKIVLLYILFTVGTCLLIIAVFCLIRNFGRQSTLSLEGTAHYAANDDISRQKKAMSNNIKSDLRNNPAFVNDS